MTHDLVRLAAAAVVLLAYALFSLACLSRRKVGAVAGDALLIAYASQTGAAEAQARAAAAGLERSGARVTLLELGDLTLEALQRARTALFVVATTGEGDPPDRALRFARTAMAAPADLSRLRVGVLALGDRNYAHYCGFGRRLDRWLTASGATPLFARIEVDAGDRAALSRWRKALAQVRHNADLRDLAETPAQAFRLSARTLLNPEGVGDPAFLLALTAEGVAPAWQAGDVVEVEREDGAGVLHREYSIASLPQDGGIELIVRRFRLLGGGMGAMSGWLTKDLPLGGVVRLRVRSNSSFHAPAEDRPMILVGSGTGLAGLRAHVRQRAGAWLLFGERSREGDFLLQSEIEGWLRDGALERLDLAFSRDDGEDRYVQDLLRRNADALRERFADGAVLFVCGRKAMGQDVDAALADILGADALETLRESGRYRRDVY